MEKRIALLGSTGSIGTQSIDVLSGLNYKVVALAAGKNVDLAESQVRVLKPEYVGISDEPAAELLRQRLSNMPDAPIIYSGQDAAKQVVLSSRPEMVLNAIVGIAGLNATLAAIEVGADIALANKESLVTGGELVMNGARKNHCKILPVDSEHSAIFQCIQDKHSAKSIKKIILTASGGPFFGLTTSQLENKTKQDALKHPNWDMGAKITIDSSTLMNKGLEFIEAMWLFSVPPDDIEIVVQRQSVIHSMVQFADNSILAQLGTPDMRIPIQYALTWPERIAGPAPELDFASLTKLDFGMPDYETFRCLSACRKAAEKGGLAPCAANCANEEAVALFLQDKIGFLDIGRLVEGCVDKESYFGAYTIKDVYECDKMARSYVRANI